MQRAVSRPIHLHRTASHLDPSGAFVRNKTTRIDVLLVEYSGREKEG